MTPCRRRARGAGLAWTAALTLLAVMQPGFARAQPAIQVETIGPPDSSTAGVLTPDDGGLGTEMWADTSAMTGLALVEALPRPASVPAMADLTWRLLATAGRVVEGGPGGVDLLAARVHGLVDAGRAGTAADVLEVAGYGERTKGPAIDSVALSTGLLAGRNNLVCAAGESGAAGPTPEPFLAAIALCRLAGDQQDDAQLAYDLWRETGAGQAGLPALFEIAFGRKASPPKDLEATPMAIALVARTGVAPPAAWFEDPPLRLLPGLLALKAPEPAGLVLAERAEAAGLMDTSALAARLGAAALPAAATSDPRAFVRQTPGPVGRAALVRALAGAPEADRPALLVAATEAYAAAGLRATGARLVREPLMAIRPDLALAGYAPGIVRGLLALGERDRALVWWRTLDDAATFNPDAAFQALGLWPLIQVADGGDTLAWDRESPQRWWRSQASLPGATRRASVAAALFAALGGDAPEVWQREKTPSALRPAQSADLEEAAASERTAETVLRAAAALGTDAVTTVPPVDLGLVVAALLRVGLKADARALALDLALANGL